MSKTKKFFGCVGVTALFWLLSRILPSIIGALAPNTIFLRAAAMLAMLLAGWAVVKALSKENFTGCIRTNLYVFAFLEGIGALEALTYVITNLSYSTGRYSYDINGIAYSDYVSYFGGILLYEIIYVILCICLAKNSAKK
jgi:thiol:disulfide interchange protein